MQPNTDEVILVRASELIAKLQTFVDEGKDYEVWTMLWSDEAKVDDPAIIYTNDERIFI